MYYFETDSIYVLSRELKNCTTIERFNSVDEIILDVVSSVLDLVNWLTFS